MLPAKFLPLDRLNFNVEGADGLLGILSGSLGVATLVFQKLLVVLSLVNFSSTLIVLLAVVHANSLLSLVLHVFFIRFQ